MKRRGGRAGSRAVLTILLLTISACTPAMRELPEVPAEIQSDHAGSSPAAAHHWSYAAGPGGPDSWASLPESSCGKDSQSPVDIPLDVLTARLSSGASPEAPGESFTLAGAELPLIATNDRRIVLLDGSPKVGLVVGGKTIALSSVRLHAPAEHRLGGVHPDLEFEFDFTGDGAHYGLSLLFRLGAANPALETLVSLLPESREYSRKSLPGALRFEGLFEGSDILVYDGSMSIPPCSPVTRLVFARVAEISEQQLEKLLRALPHPSARPLDDLRAREVRLASFSLSSAQVPEPEKTPTTPSPP